MKRVICGITALFVLSVQTNAQCWQKIESGGSHTLAIKSDGTLWAWGNNFHGALGDGTFTNRSTPVQIGTGANWAFITANETVNSTPKQNFSLAIKTDGTLWAWGNNSYGQLGIGPTGNYNTPVQVGTDNDWLTVSAGATYSLGIKTNGTLWAWGNNQNGELGLGDFVPRSVPVQVGTGTNWANVSAGYYASAAITTGGTIWTWGVNITGQLGDGTNIDKNVPVQVGTETDWQIVSNSGIHMMAIKSNGTLWGWGSNSVGQLGNGTFTNSNTPLQIGIDNNWDTVVTAYQHTAALKTDGTRWAWGFNNNGEYGIGNLDWYTEPFQTGAETDWQLLSVKSYNAFGIRTGSNLWGCGLNENGQVGDGTTIDRLSLVQVSCNIILPVTWLYVKGKLLNNNTSIIEWATASESNSSHFEIEHSNNGISFAKTGIVNAAGFSSSITNYSFTHLSPVAGKNYYRIKQVDLDDRYNYSRIVTLINSPEQNIIAISPNPAQNFIQLNTNTTKPCTLRIFSMEGKLLLQQQLSAGNQQQSIDISKLPAGMYSLQMQTNETVKTASFIKQ